MKDINGFCKLEKDIKTFHILSIYIADMEMEHDLLCEDQKIQEKEIIDHLKVNGFNKGDTKEALKWIEDHGKNERQYLNSIKFLYILWKKKKMDLTKETFEYLVNMYNLEWLDLLSDQKVSCIFNMIF